MSLTVWKYGDIGSLQIGQERVMSRLTLRESYVYIQMSGLII
jgi:hypothetical protein